MRLLARTIAWLSPGLYLRLLLWLGDYYLPDSSRADLTPHAN